MTPLDVDFRTRPGWPAALIGAAAGGLVCVALALGVTAQRAVEESRRIEAEERFLRERHTVSRGPHIRALPSYQATDAAAMLRVAAFDWTGLFATLHGARTAGVRMLALDVDPVGGVARIEIEALRAEDALAHQAALNGGETQARWRLLKMQAPTTDGSPVTASFEWIAPAAR